MLTTPGNLFDAVAEGCALCVSWPQRMRHKYNQHTITIVELLSRIQRKKYIHLLNEHHQPNQLVLRQQISDAQGLFFHP